MSSSLVITYSFIAVAFGSVLVPLQLQPQNSCRCRPHEACWPSVGEWGAFNDSIDGNLLSVRPIAHACYAPTPNASECERLAELSRDSGWRAEQHGALQDWIWEVGADDTAICLFEYQPQTTCHQGRVPLYSANVRRVSHVQNAVRFAKKHDLRLVIRNTGHDGAGRSSARDSFQINTHFMDEIQEHEDFLPYGSVESVGSAVSIGAGVELGQLYTKGSMAGFIVVGGDCPTVGAAGGFFQGGGVSPMLSYTMGLAVDNTLEVEAVTADGDLVIANEYLNQDLFWALKGGGGGTFAVVTRVTIRTYSDLPVIIADLVVTTSDGDSSFWAHAPLQILSTMRSFNEEGIPGTLSFGGRPWRATLSLYFLNTTDEASVASRLSVHLDRLRGAGLIVSESLLIFSKTSSALPKEPGIYPLNYAIIQGTVLVSSPLIRSTQGIHQLATILSQIPFNNPADVVFINTLGGAVITKNGTTYSSMHPGWRNSALLINLLIRVPPSLHARKIAQQHLTQVQMPLLYAIEPNYTVSYMNMGDPNEPNFQDAFWGDNYARLLEIKNKWDRQGLFVTRLGVGSEAWDDDGMCMR